MVIGHLKLYYCLPKRVTLPLNNSTRVDMLKNQPISQPTNQQNQKLKISNNLHIVTKSLLGKLSEYNDRQRRKTEENLLKLVQTSVIFSLLFNANK